MRSLSKNVLFLAVPFLVLTLAIGTVQAGKCSRAERGDCCIDGVDNDGDGDVDCDDSNCSAEPACVVPPPPPPDNCQIQFNSDFTDGGRVDSDGVLCIADPTHQYCHGDQKVLMDFLIAGGDGDPRAIFAFDSSTGPVKTRKGEVVRQARIDLSDFVEADGDGCWNGTALDPFGDCATSGELPFVLGFYSGRGGLNLCDLCVPGPADCTDTCYMGHELDVKQLTGESDPNTCTNCCPEGTSSSKGAVGLYLNFPVENAIWGKMAVIYNPRWAGADPWQCSDAMPGVVERTAENEWKITATDGCLINGGASGWEVLDDLGDASFTLTITTQP